MMSVDSSDITETMARVTLIRTLGRPNEYNNIEKLTFAIFQETQVSFRKTHAKHIRRLFARRTHIIIIIGRIIIPRSCIYECVCVYYVTRIGFCGTGRKKIPFNQFKAIRSLLLVQAEDKLSTLIFFYARSPVVFRAPRRRHHRHRRRRHLYYYYVGRD